MTNTDRLTANPPDERQEIGTEEGQPCLRYPEPDGDEPRGYRPKPCGGVMVECQADGIYCDTCNDGPNAIPAARLEIDMPLQDKIECLIRDEVSVGRSGDVEGIAEAAEAIIAALPDMVVPLVWAASEVGGWNDDYHTLPTKYTIRCADENGWKLSFAGGFGYSSSADVAKVAANAHNAAAVVAALTGVKP